MLGGDERGAIDLALSALTSLGFRVTDRASGYLELQGPGMNSTSQSPLVGASRIDLRAGGGELSLRAELGGVRKMARFVVWFPLGLCALVAAALGAVFWSFGDERAALPGIALAVGANVVLWLVLGPWMARWIHRRTARSLDALLRNAAEASQASARGES